MRRIQHDQRQPFRRTPTERAPHSFLLMRGFVFLLSTVVFQAAGQTAKQPPGTDANDLLRAGRAAEQHGDHAAAIQDFREALAIRPGFAPAHAALGAALAAAGQLDAAIEEDQQALAAHADEHAVRMNLARVYYQMGDLTHAREQAESVHQAAPQDIPAVLLLSSIYVKLGREADVVALLTPLEPSHESNSEFEYLLAFSLIQTGRITEGVSRMEKVAQATHSANAYVIAGAALLHKGDMAAAESDLVAAWRLDGSIPGLATMLGQAESAQHDTAAATRAFQAALRENPRDFDANVGLGVIYLGNKDYKDAQPLLELALELVPQSPLARMQMARLDEGIGKNAEAATYLEALVKDEPNWIHAHWELANVYFSLDRLVEGKRERAIAQDLEMRRREQQPEVK